MIKIQEDDVLLVVDVQNDFCPGGALAVPGGDEVVSVVNDIAGRFSHVLQTQDWHPAGHTSFATTHGRNPFEWIELSYGEQILWPDHCVQGSIGAEFHKDLNLPGVELIIRKGYRQNLDSYSAFYENDRKTPTGLGGYLREREIKRIFLAGLATDFCVRWSAVDARRLGFEVVLMEDGCRAIDQNGSLQDAMKEMHSVGISVIRSDDL